jgi:hypothetical protein
MVLGYSVQRFAQPLLGRSKGSLFYKLQDLGGILL